MNRIFTSTSPLQNRFANWLAPMLAFALLALLLPFPGARIPSSHSWRAELLTTLFLCSGLIALYRRKPDFLSGMLAIRDRWIFWIVICLGSFTFWSFLSVRWAYSPYSTVHHTLVWAEYVLFFLFIREMIAQGHGARFVVGVSLWVCGVIGILCLIDYATLPDFKALEGVLRARYSSYAELLVTALPMVWITAAYVRRKTDRYLVILIGAAGWTAAMLSLSKGAFIAGVIGFLLTFVGCLLFSFRRFRPRILASAAIWVAITLAVQIGFSALTPIPATVDYISGRADATRATSTARIFVWKVGKQMVADNWLLGVGADNFGVMFNASRAKYRVPHPDDPKDETVSDNTIERTHNEPLQILAELGVFGVLLLLIPLVLFSLKLVQVLWSTKFRVSPMLWAALGGMTAFAVSSMVSSFSFRLVQTGIVFFMVFAVAVNEIVKLRNSRLPQRSDVNTHLKFAALPVLVSILLLAMLTTYALKGAAEYCVFKGDRTADKASALALYSRAIDLDPDYAGAYLRGSGKSYGDKDYVGAAKQLRTAIDHGFGVVLTYSALAECYTKTGDSNAAEQTFAEALRIFPRSVFLRVRHSIFLSDEGRSDESDKEMAAARSVDARQANGWFNLITIGSLRAFYAARADDSLALPDELLPADAVLQYLDAAPGSDGSHH